MRHPDVVQHPDPLLRVRSRPVGRPDPAVHALARAMGVTLASSGGVGLAAIQVGVPLRLFLARLAPGAEPLVLIDPELSWGSDGRVPSLEGCLSIAAPRLLVARHAAVRVRFTDLDGAASEVEAEGRAAAVLQHEMDHLDGRLIIDLAPWGEARDGGTASAA